MDSERLAEYCKRIELFHGLNPHDVEKILSKGLTMRVTKGEAVFFEDTVGNQMYIVLGGLLGVYKGDKPIAELRTGDMFGEMALVTNDRRSATVKALEDSRLFVLGEETFKKLMTKSVSIQILFNIIRTLSHRLSDTNRRVAG